MSNLNSQHKDLIETIAKSNGFAKYELEEQSASEKGHGYTSDIISITIKDADKKLQLILKLASVDENLRKSIPLGNIFAHEVWMYDKILPQLTKFQTDNGLLHGFEGYPKCYATSDTQFQETIILEDLIAGGYRLWNRKIPMNHDHISLGMREYGKLHAVSFAMNKKNPEQFKALKKFFESIDIRKEKKKESLKFFVDNTNNKISKAIKGNKKLEQGLERLVDGALKLMVEEMEAEQNKTVFTHGDCWCNNIFFKYENAQDNTPSKVCLVDWQIANIRNPVFDISYFFSTSSSKETLYDYKTYLKIYHDSLSQSLRSMSCDPEEIYPFSLLEEQWSKFSKSCLFLAPMIFSVLVVDKENTADLTNAKSTKDMFNQLSNAGSGEAIVHQRITDLMTFMIDCNLL